MYRPNLELGPHLHKVTHLFEINKLEHATYKIDLFFVPTNIFEFESRVLTSNNKYKLSNIKT